MSVNGVVGTYAATMAGLYCLTAALVYRFMLSPSRVTTKTSSLALTNPRSNSNPNK